MSAPGALRNNPDYIALRNEVADLRRQLRKTSGMTATTYTAGQQQAKRFRIGVKTQALVVGTIQVDIVWSTPLPSANYSVDAGCSAVLSMPTVTVTNQTAAGCTVSFANNVVAATAIIVVLAVAPAQ